MTLQTGSSNSGFTLVEVVIAAALLCLLVACSILGVTSVTHASRLMSQRVTAQGACIALFEEMKACAVDNSLTAVDSDTADHGEGGETNPFRRLDGKMAFLESQGLGPGSRNMHLSYFVVAAEDNPMRWTVTVKCSWEFMDRTWSGTERNLVHEEELQGMIVDSYSSSGRKMELSVNGMRLNPNYNASTKSYTIPSYMRIVDANGNVYTHNDLASGRVPASIDAVSVVVYPGGGGEQKPYPNNPNLVVNNAKTYAYYSRSDDNPISVSLTRSNGLWMMNMYCSDASVNIE